MLSTAGSFYILVKSVRHTAQKMKFSIKDFFSKCEQIRRKLRIWSRLLKKSLIENFIFCVVSANMKKEQLLKTHFLPIKCQCSPHIETSQLICCANGKGICALTFPLDVTVTFISIL